MLSVSVRWGRGTGVRSIPVGPAGLLAPGLLLRPILTSLLPLRRAECTWTLAGVTSTCMVVWSGSVSVLPVWVWEVSVVRISVLLPPSS